MTRDQFLQKYREAVAAVPPGARRTLSYGSIRWIFPCEQRFCPITLVGHHMLGRYVEPCLADTIGDEIGMGVELCVEVMQSADNEQKIEIDPDLFELRQELLSAN